jgi:hypothetical protein
MSGILRRNRTRVRNYSRGDGFAGDCRGDGRADDRPPDHADPSELQQVECDNGLVVWFNNEPKLHGEIVDGTVALLFEAEGKAQKGSSSSTART